MGVIAAEPQREQVIHDEGVDAEVRSLSRRLDRDQTSESSPPQQNLWVYEAVSQLLDRFRLSISLNATQ
jgi:hypothetical protein